MYDIIIVGAGPAGMNAALYAKRAGLNVLLLEKNIPGGLINITNKVENYLGGGSVSGSELVEKMTSHLKDFNISHVREEVIEIINEENKKIVKTNKNTYEAKTIILCIGRAPKKAKPEITNKLEGNGISYCAVCDAPFYKDKVVGVVGGGNSAFEEGLYLSNFASKLYIIIRKPQARADEVFIEKANKKDNIEILYNSEITDILEENGKLSKIIINGSKEIKLDGLFLYIGYQPTSNFLNNLGITDENGYVKVDENMETNIKGIYAAGDIIKKDVYQIITAASEGAIAALSAKKFIKN